MMTTREPNARMTRPRYSGAELAEPVGGSSPIVDSTLGSVVGTAVGGSVVGAVVGAVVGEGAVVVGGGGGHGSCAGPSMSVIQPLNVLQISLVVAAESASTLTPMPNESGEGVSGRLMALNEMMVLVLGAVANPVTLMPMSLPPVIVL